MAGYLQLYFYCLAFLSFVPLWFSLPPLFCTGLIYIDLSALTILRSLPVRSSDQRAFRKATKSARS